jgi:hypothetical protein
MASFFSDESAQKCSSRALPCSSWTVTLKFSKALMRLSVSRLNQHISVRKDISYAYGCFEAYQSYVLAQCSFASLSHFRESPYEESTPSLFSNVVGPILERCRSCLNSTIASSETAALNGRTSRLPLNVDIMTLWFNVAKRENERG